MKKLLGIGDLKLASVDKGREDAEAFVDAAVQFIEKWKVLRPKQ